MYLYLLLCFSINLFIPIFGQYTFWRYAGNSHDYGTLSTKQRIFDYFSRNKIESNKIDADWIQYPIITSNNHILIYGYNKSCKRLTLYHFDSNLTALAEQVIASEISDLFNFDGGSCCYPIYHEYNNNKYFIHSIVWHINTETGYHKYGRLVVVKIIDDSQMNVLWEFSHTIIGPRHDRYQPIIYNNYVLFQHPSEQNGSQITRHVFNVDTGSSVWSNTNTLKYYWYRANPIVFEKYGEISMICNSPDYPTLHSMNLETGDINWSQLDSDNINLGYENETVQIFTARSTGFYEEHDLLMRLCKIKPANYKELSSYTTRTELCVFNTTNGKFITAVGLNMNYTLYEFVLNPRNNSNDFIIIGRNKRDDSTINKYAAIYYNIFVENEKVTFVQQAAVYGQDYAFLERIYFIDSDSTIIAQQLAGHGNTCQCCQSCTYAYLIIKKYGIQSNTLCLNSRDYPLFPNHENVSAVSQQLIYFVDDVNKKIIAYENYKTSDGDSSDTISDECSTFTLTPTSKPSCSPIFDDGRSEPSASSNFIVVVVLVSIVVLIFCICVAYFILRKRKLNRNILQQNDNNLQLARRQSHERQNANVEKPAKTLDAPTKSKKINTEPAKNYHANVRSKIVNENNDVIGKQPTLSYSAMNCVICLDVLLDNEASALLCGHRFHTHCIEEYNETKSECPLCRQNIEFI